MKNLDKLKELSNYLLETEPLLSAYWQIIPCILVIIQDGKFIKVNPAIYNILGYTPEEVINKEFSNFVHPDDIQKSLMAVRDILNKGIKITNFVNRYKHKNGHWVYLSWAAWSDIKNGFIFAKATDISEKQLACDRMMAALKLAPIGIFLTDKNGDCVFVNDRWSSLTGLSFEEAKGTGWINGILKSERNAVFDGWYKYAAERNIGNKFSFQTKYHNIKTGIVTPVTILSYAYGEGDFIGYVDYCVCLETSLS